MSSKCPLGRCDSSRICPIANASRYMRNTESRRVRAELRRDVLALRRAGAARWQQLQVKMAVGAERMAQARVLAMGRVRAAAVEERNRPAATQVREAAARLAVVPA